jgi:cytosine/adenosine deaminase-related metal-dependent hydrolase
VNVAVAGDKADTGTLTAGHDAKAVVLDFVTANLIVRN